jgi:hypothetical protein
MTNKEDAQKLAKLILQKRRYDKMIKTYYIRIGENTYPDSCFRGYFTHCSTETGRLTSDLQQVPSKKVGKIKQIFVSRYN